MQGLRPDASAYVGMTESEAIEAIQKIGLKARITERDGKSFMGTCDFRLDRINLIIKEGKVIETNVG